jgi:RNA polymerase sigma factor (sigma-70 family)
MKWCLNCGAVQSGTRTCGGCGGRHQLDPLAFTDLYKAYADPLRRFVRRLAADRGLPESQVDTEGVVHDTFAILLSGSRLPIRNPAAWLFTVARNQVSKATAARRRIAPGDPADHLRDGSAAWASVASPADAEDISTVREVMNAIAWLPDHQRIATYLHQVEGWSLAEIGAYLNCAASTAGVHISRGTVKVRSALSTKSHRRYASYSIRFAGLRSVGVLLFAVALIVVGRLVAGKLGIPNWVLAAAMTLAWAVPFVIVRVIGWWLRVETRGRLQRRFNRWLRTGRPLNQSGVARRH